LLLDAVDLLLAMLEGSQRPDVLLVIGLRVVAQRGRGTSGLGAFFRRCVTLGFALGAFRIDRIDAAFQLIGRLVRQRAPVRLAPAA